MDTKLFAICIFLMFIVACNSSPKKFAYTKVLGHEAICQKIERTACGMELSECVGTPLTFSCVHEVIILDITQSGKVLEKPEPLHQN